MNRVISPLKRHILLRLLLAAGALSALTLLMFFIGYRNQLVAEHGRASLGFNLLLQAALENAMLKRDVPGLAEIVVRLGSQPGIRGVMILNPRGDVRFASSPGLVGRSMPTLVPSPDVQPTAEFHLADDGQEALRSINPVRNKEACVQCHGAVASNPVNGILVVDYDAGDIHAQALKSALALSIAGTAVLILILAILWRSLQRQVLSPVRVLSRASMALEAGRLDERVHLDCKNELADLGQSFNRMAERIEGQMARLRMHETYLQEILDSLPDGVRVIRVSDRKVMLANRAFCEQANRPASVILGGSCHLSSHNRHTPCVPTLVVCPLVELDQISETLKTSHHHQRADGTLLAAEVHAVLTELDDGHGKERCVVESIRDLGQAARISHEQRLSELGLLAAGIAHEIHNPLGSVRLGVQGLMRSVREGHTVPGQIDEYLGLIDQEIDNCIAVTRRLLLLARPPTSSLQLVVINDALRDTLRLLEYDAQGRKISQRIEVPDIPLRILADEAEIRMIFLNLLQNAHHAMPSGGILQARLRLEGDDALIEIEDNGVGMEPELVTHVFDPFFSRRADGITGTGLGLTITKNFVERMAGEIQIDTEPGKGSCFRIRLPLADIPVPTETQ